jgi:hypothetical protein
VKTFVSEAKFILIFFIGLTVVTIFSYVDLFSSINKSSHKSLDTLNYEIVSVRPNLVRAPASVEPNNDSLTLSKEFLCNNKPESKLLQDKVSNHMVMINFKICKESKSLNQINIENQSNGFKAQVFKLEANNFKTDYIQLNEGLNKLKLEFILKDGQKLAESLEILSGS